MPSTYLHPDILDEHLLVEFPEDSQPEPELAHGTLYWGRLDGADVSRIKASAARKQRKLWKQFGDELLGVPEVSYQAAIERFFSGRWGRRAGWWEVSDGRH
jgi:hypothetical protein